MSLLNSLREIKINQFRFRGSSVSYRHLNTSEQFHPAHTHPGLQALGTSGSPSKTGPILPQHLRPSISTRGFQVSPAQQQHYFHPSHLGEHAKLPHMELYSTSQPPQGGGQPSVTEPPAASGRKKTSKLEKENKSPDNSSSSKGDFRGIIEALQPPQGAGRSHSHCHKQLNAIMHIFRLKHLAPLQSALPK